MISFADYQTTVLAVEADPQQILAVLTPEQVRLLHVVCGLADEVGELAGAIKKHVFYRDEDGRPRPLDLVNLAEEAGDIIWYLGQLLDECGVPLDRVLRANIAKLKARYPNGFSQQDAYERNLPGERAALESHVQ